MQSTPALLPGKSHGWRSLIGYSPWGHKESDTTEVLATMPPMGKLRLRGEKYVPGKGQSQDWNLDFLFQI